MGDFVLNDNNQQDLAGIAEGRRIPRLSPVIILKLALSLLLKLL